jgi:GR25 family glycosyltransferase involved in LPS biosynthesis
MVKIELINMKQIENKTESSSLIFCPINNKKNNYSILFKTEESNPIYFQFVLNTKFTNLVEIISNNNSKDENDIKSFEIFPYGGIIYSNKLTHLETIEIKLKPVDMCSRIIISKQLETPIQIIISSSSINYIKKLTWDNIFIINLVRRQDRKEQMISRLKEENITRYKFIEAFDGLEPEINNQFIQLKNEKNLKIVTPGHFACLLSHIKAIKIARKKGYDSIMILEDDVFFEKDFVSKLNNLILPDFDFLYLGGIMSKKKVFPNRWAFFNSNRIMGAYGYIVKSSIYDIIIKELEKLEEYVDIFYIKQIQPNFKTIILDDIIKTDLTSSDTSSKSKVMTKRLDYLNKKI